jgi:hypothetical protein
MLKYMLAGVALLAVAIADEARAEEDTTKAQGMIPYCQLAMRAFNNALTRQDTANSDAMFFGGMCAGTIGSISFYSESLGVNSFCSPSNATVKMATELYLAKVATYSNTLDVDFRTSVLRVLRAQWSCTITRTIPDAPAPILPQLPPGTKKF